MIRRLLIASVLLLGACANQAPLPASTPHLSLPLQLHVLRERSDGQQEGTLMIQREGQALLWSLTDRHGALQARQILSNDTWQTTPPSPVDPQARQLFAALLFALTSADDIPALYPSAQAMDLTRTLPHHWQIIYQSSLVFTVNMQNPQASYRITPIRPARPVP